MGANLSEPDLTKKTQQNQNSQLKYYSIQIQGWQKQMQNNTICKLNIDSNKNHNNSIFAIFDGYRGYQISTFVKQTSLSILINTQQYIDANYQQALRQTFLKIDQLLSTEKGQKRLQQIRAENGIQTRIQGQKIADIVGCVGTVILITKKKILVANIGNVRAFLFKDKIIQLTQTHSLDSIGQKTRIQNAGGTITQETINGNIQLPRSFGLLSYKKNSQLKPHQQMITCYPQIKTIQRSISDNFIFIGCNGLFEKYSNKQKQMLKQKLINSSQFKQEKYMECLQKIIGQTIPIRIQDEKNSLGMKNMSGILIKFNQL